jgi:tetratricopeptide (TPR) repeat protein
MIERLLAADDALARGDLDLAERLFRQTAEADPRNAIAAVGMGRVAAARDDADAARTWFQRALDIDREEAAARRLLAALDREMAASGDAQAASVDAPFEVPVGASAEAPAEVEPRVEQARRRRPSLFGRILRWLGLSRDRA